MWRAASPGELLIPRTEKANHSRPRLEVLLSRPSLHRLNTPFAQRMLDDKLAELNRFVRKATDSPHSGG